MTLSECLEWSLWAKGKIAMGLAAEDRAIPLASWKEALRKVKNRIAELSMDPEECQCGKWLDSCAYGCRKTT